MSIQVSGIENINKSLHKLQTKLSSNQPLMAKIGNYIKTDIELAFEKETSPFGKKWKPLSNKTKKLKTKRGKSGKILRYEGNLADNWYVKAAQNEVTISNNASFKGFPYGLTHQFGTTNAFGRGINIPARPFLPVDENGVLEKGLSEQINDMLKNEIEKIFR